MSEFRTKVVKALGWSAGGKLFSQVISMGFGIALARMLTPDDFGLIAMMMVFTGLAGLLMDVGLGSALVQKKDITELHYSTVFWTNLALGILLTGLVFLGSSSVAAFYGRQELVGIGHILSINFFLNASALVPRQRLVKELTFKVLAVADLLGMIIAGVAAILMVRAGYGFWALAWQVVILRCVATGYVWCVARWLPGFQFSTRALLELFGFSFYVFATRVIRYVTQRSDKLLAGKFLGGDAVGFLDKAQSMMLFPLQNVSHVMGSVMFPALSMIQDDPAHVKSVYMRCTQAIALLTFPMMTGMFAVSENFVLGVLGEQWSGLVTVLRILCVAGIATSIVTVTGSVYLSQGKAKLQFKVNLFTRPIALLGVASGIPWGIEGIATGATIATFINSAITLTVAGKLIGLQLSEFVGSLMKTLFSAVVMGVIVLSTEQMLYDFQPLARFFLQILEGVMLYAILVILVRVRALRDVWQIVKEKQLST